MDYNKIGSIKSSIDTLLSQQRLKEAFAKLRELTAEISDGDIAYKIDNMEQSYRYMVQYAAEGAADPERDKIHAEIIDKMRELCDIATNELIAKTSPRLYYSTLRVEKMRPESIAAIVERYSRAVADEKEYAALPAEERDHSKLVSMLDAVENIESILFKKIWTLYPVANHELESIRELLSSESIPLRTRELAMSAVMLNLLEHFSEPLLLVLLDIYSSTKDVRLQIKSLCCALIVMHKYRNIISHSEEIKLRISALADNPEWCADLVKIFLQLIRSRGTERIARKMQDELVPEIMKLKPELRRKLQGNDIMPDDSDDFAKNPDWQEMLDKSGITDKIMELNRMQAEGNDVFIGSFSRLKTFPFFNNIANWFLPFDPMYSAVYGIFKTDKPAIMTVIDRSGVFCDSDKYSFVLSLTGMSEQQRSLMLNQFEEQNTQIMEMASSSIPDPEKERDNIANKFVQDLYRFFNLFSRRSEFYNPFTTSLNLIDVPMVSSILSDDKNLKLIAEFYFKLEFHEDALRLFTKIEEREPASVETYQKIGFCHEKAKRYAEAIANYEKAELIKASDLWTMKHLAACHRAAGNLADAISYYKRIEELQPQNVAIANSIGNCLLETGNYREALKYYFKVDYLAPKGNRTLRPIAWCSFLDGNYTQSKEYYDRIIASEPTADDYINSGHVELATGNVRDAVADYTQAATGKTDGLQHLVETIGNDSRNLTDAGVSPTLIAIILDKIRYSLQ